MKLFVDTSSLFKLYHTEEGTAEMELLFSNNMITSIFLSDITKVEFASTITKKVRIGEITLHDAQTILTLFETDCAKYTFIATSNMVIEQAKTLVTQYGVQGLRTLDSIQLATALLLRHKANLFLTADSLLQSLFITEQLPIKP